MAGNHTLGTIRGTIEIDYDGAGIVKAVRDTEKAKSSMGGIEGVSNKVLSAFTKFGGGALKVAGAVGVVTNGATLLASTLAVLGPLAAAGFAAAPGVILSYAAAMGIAKIATAGVGDALAAAGEDSKKFEEAIKKLSPEAQKFARAYRSSLPALQAVKQQMQDAFFKGTAGQVAGVVQRITSLRTEATGVARAMGQVVQKVVQFATSGQSLESVRKILGGVRDFLYKLVPVVGPLVRAFLGLGAQSSDFAETLGTKVANALTKFTDFLNRVDVASIFETALPIVQSLGGFIATLAAIAGQLFSIFTVDGADAAGILFDLADKLRTFLESAQGQAALQALGQAMSAISGAAGQIFLALLQALAPTIVALAPGVAQLASQIAGVMVPAINALNPLLVDLAGFLSENMSWIGPLAGAVVAAAAAYKVYAAAAGAVNSVKDVLTSKIVKNTAAWVANAAVATGKWLASAAAAIARTTVAIVSNTAAWVANRAAQAGAAAAGAARSIAAWTASTAAIVANRAALIAHAVVAGAQAAAAWVASTAAIIANRVAVVASTVAMAAVRAATIAWTAVQWALNAALNANPIGLVVAAIALLVGGIILLWKNSETFRTIVLAVWSAIKTAIAATVNWFMGTAWPIIKSVIDFIINYYKTLWNITKAVWTGIFNAIKAALNWIKDVATAVWNGIVAGIRAYINLYKTIIMGGINAVRNGWNAVMNAIRTVARAVWTAITNFIRGEINRVKSIINGIRTVINVVKNAFTSAKNAAVSQLSSLVSWVRGLPGRVTGALGNLGRLLYNKGRDLIRGFADGIASMIGAVRDKAKSVVSAVTRFLPGSPAKEGPLSGRGYVLLRARRFMADFARGINEGSQKPTAALVGSVSPLARATVPSTSRTTSGASTAAMSAIAGPATGQRTYRIAIGDKVFADLVVDAVTGNPVSVKKAADEGARRSAWAGSGR